MTSECYVYIQLPGTAEVVTCGRFVREELPAGGAVGRFIYGRSYLQRTDAVALDPFQLPLRQGWQETAKLNGVFGAIRDAAPDGWGQYVIERSLGRTDLTIVDFLLQSPEDRVGALSFGLSPQPPAPVRTFNRVVRLAELLEIAEIIEAGQGSAAPSGPAAEQIRQLLAQGSSALGGARPKNVVEDDEGLWVAKFPSRGDHWDNAAVEAAMLDLARACDIQAPPARVERVGDKQVLLVKRFDRERLGDVDAPYIRYRMVSALTVLAAEESATDRRNWSYVLLADELQRWSMRSVEDKRELFRRMVLNALVSNLDDHPRNHAFIAPRAEFRLAPAYDITPSPVHGIERRDLAMVCGSYGRAATRANLISEAPHFAVDRAEADRVITEMKGRVATRWEADVRRNGGSVDDCEAVRRAFLYEGFEFPTEIAR
jgi:serine/threonine-protein kinase HipA